MKVGLKIHETHQVAGEVDTSGDNRLKLSTLMDFVCFSMKSLPSANLHFLWPSKFICYNRILLSQFLLSFL